MPEDSPPLVSIVLAAYVSTPHQEQLLRDTLKTVAAQTCQNFELILVDDGSPMDLRQIAAETPRALFIRQQNAGPALARNNGVRASRGRFFVFLDADDHLLPQALEAGLRELEEHPECGFAVGPREEMTYEGEPVHWSVPPPPSATNLYTVLLGFHWYIIPPSSVMFRREVVDSIGEWRNPWGADDLDYYLRAARKFRARCFQAPAVTRYRRYSASSSRDGARMLHSVRTVYDRQRSVVQGDPEAQAAFHRGLSQLTEIFRDCLAENLRDRLREGRWLAAARAAALLLRESPARLFQEVKSLFDSERLHGSRVQAA